MQEQKSLIFSSAYYFFFLVYVVLFEILRKNFFTSEMITNVCNLRVLVVNIEVDQSCEGETESGHRPVHTLRLWYYLIGENLKMLQRLTLNVIQVFQGISDAIKIHNFCNSI